MRALHLVLPGDPATLSGGYEYDRRIAAGLRALGWRVEVHALDASFPAPTPAALAHAREALARIPDGALVLLDGLALGAMPAIATAERDRLRLVALVHHPLAEETGLDAASAAALRASETRALGAVRGVITTSRATARALAAYHVDPARIRVVEPGTDPAPLAQGSAGDTVELLCVAAVVPRKGHAVLVEALAALAHLPWRLACVGSLERDAATAASLRRQIDACRLAARVTLAGEHDRAALHGYYEQADAFVLATFHEGYGMAFAEALARGLPIVGTRAGAVPDTVPPDAGVLVPPGDVAALRQALARVIGDPAARARLAEGARRGRALLSTWPQASTAVAAALAAFQA